MNQYNDANLDMTKEETNEKPECNWFVSLSSTSQRFVQDHSTVQCQMFQFGEKKVILKKAISVVEDDDVCGMRMWFTELNGVNYMFNVWTSKGTCFVHKIWIKFRFIICTLYMWKCCIALYCLLLLWYVSSMRHWIDRNTILWMGTGHNGLHYFINHKMNEWASLFNWTEYIFPALAHRIIV